MPVRCQLFDDPAHRPRREPFPLVLGVAPDDDFDAQQCTVDDLGPERHFGVTLAFMNCHRGAAFRPGTEQDTA
jgi:hypothetical protein